MENLKIALEGLQADRQESRAMMQYAQELQEIWDNALVDAARNNRGTVEENAESRRQASPRKKYWRPDLAEGEWRLLERRMAEEIGNRENFLDEATKWVYANEEGVQVFALYGIGDGTEATPLYAVGGKKAAAAAADMQKFVSGGYRYDKGTGTALSRIRGFLRTQGDGGGDIRETSRGRSTGTDDALYGGERKGNAGKSAERGPEDQRGIKEKFSMREPVEETRDLLAMHNMTVDNLRGALKLGGLPMPSIAIVKASAGHSKYGPISVVFEKNTIDPQADRRNKVYGGDAYTPTAPQVEYPVRYEAMQRVEKHIAELSEQVAGGIFRNDTALRRLGIDSESSMSAEALADRLSRDDSVQAAYLADAGKALEPVRKLKEFSRYGNGALQQLVQDIGVQELARINAEMDAGNYDAATDAEKSVRDIIRSAYEVKHRGFLDRKPELKQQRIDKYMDDNVSRITVEDFVRNAWEFYQDNGATTDEIDRWATADKLHEAVDPADVKKWMLGQLDGVLGEAGIYNGKERYAPSGNERSFAQTHYAYTLENIVRAMSQTQEERGGQTFGVTAKSMQAVSTPSYGSIAEIKADSGRLGAVEGDAYDAAVEQVEKQIEQATRKVMRENKPHSDNQFDETQIIGDVMMEAAKGAKTEAAIRKVFQREGYSVSKETIGAMQAMFRAAAQLPTEYFEAKPQRAIRFDEAAAVVVPDNLPAELKRGLEKQGATVREYKAGDEQSRLEAVNVDERVRFSVRENFSKEIDSWAKDGMPEGVRFTLGSTGPVLQGLGAIESDIYMDGDKIQKILQDHPEMTLAEIKKVPQILEDPAMVLKSKTRTNSLVVLGTYRAQNGRPILAAMDLLPMENGVFVYGMQKLSSAYTKTGEVKSTGADKGAAFLRNSDVLFLDKKRATLILRPMGIQTPTSFLQSGYIGSISYKGSSVNIQGRPFSSVVKIEADNKTQSQQRDPRLSDRDVLRMAADMAQRDRSQRWSEEDLNRFDLLQRKLLQLDEANAELEALKEERKVLLAGRKAKELKKKRQQTSSSSAACFCNIRYTAGCSRRTRRGW